MDHKILRKIIKLEKRVEWRNKLLIEFSKHQKDRIKKLNKKIRELRKLL